MTNLDALKALRSTVCACGNSKSTMRTFCGPCYSKLPSTAQRALYKKIFEGYLEAYEAALKLLGMSENLSKV